jgi:signal transduction histidine kinase
LAAAICDHDKMDCVLIDFNMPILNGLELGAQLKAKSPYLPMILMTSVGDELLAADAMRNGFADYIPKSKISRESAGRTIARAVRAMDQARLIDQQREELEHFAYALAHDFKQPIRQICTFSDLIEEQIGANIDDDVARNLKFMRDAGRRLGALVDVMSQYTLLNRVPELGMVELNEIIDGVRVGLSAFLEERNGQLIAENAPAVYGNDVLLMQVVQNLVANGLRYNRSDHPTVTISSEGVASGKQRLRIRDNGIGIEARYMDEIFKPLVRLHASSEFPGTGLGLTITRKAVAALGGRIWCESEPGVGSEFVVELSSAPPAAAGDGLRAVARAA